METPENIFRIKICTRVNEKPQRESQESLLGYVDSALHGLASRWQELLICHESFQTAVPLSEAHWKTHSAPTQAHGGFMSTLHPLHGTQQHAGAAQCRSAHGKPPHRPSTSAPAPPRESSHCGGSARAAGCQAVSICRVSVQRRKTAHHTDATSKANASPAAAMQR